LLGYGPQLSICAICSGKLNSENLYFSNKEGGVLCSKHTGTKVTANFVKLLRLFINKDWNMLAKLKIDSVDQKLLKEISEHYYANLL